MDQIKVSKAKLERALDKAGLLDGDTIIESYSGRTMYGDTCFGLRMGIEDMAKVFTELHFMKGRGEIKPPELAEFNLALEDFETDSLGHGEVVYFPGYVLA